MKKLSILLVIIWMIVIFTFSNADGVKSSNQSDGIVNYITRLIHYEGDPTNIKIIVRKCAHLTEYFILGILTFNACKYNGKNTLYLPILICILYACSDELHQLFVAKRACSILDILLDSLGASLAVILRKWSYVNNKTDGWNTCK